MGVVYLARQMDLDRRVAVKVLRREAMTDAEVLARFRREARVAAKLTSPHVARILDFGTTDEGYPFMVLEYLEGNDLDDELERRGALPLEEAARYVLETCEGMKEAHQLGVVHRDLKPSNIFLANVGGRRTVKVLDFGISKVTADEQVRVTQTSSAFGTPLYMSPEHMRSTKSVDHRTDVWSLGVILYELVTGGPPFQGESATALAVAVATETFTPPSIQRPGLPRELAKNPAERYATIDELAEAIRPFATRELSAGPLEPRARTHAVETGAMTTTHVTPAKGAHLRFALLAGLGLAVLGGAGALLLSSRMRGNATPAVDAKAARGGRDPVPAEPRPSTAQAPEPTVAAAASGAEPAASAAPSAAGSSAKKPSAPPPRPSATAAPATKTPAKKDGLPLTL